MLRQASRQLLRKRLAVAVSMPLCRAMSLLSDSKVISRSGLQPLNFKGTFQTRSFSVDTAPSACQVEPPFPTAIIYNQSRHASQSVLADIRAVWGKKVRVVQVVEEGVQKLLDADEVLSIKPNTWGNLEHFTERLHSLITTDASLGLQVVKKKVVFMPGWSAFAESADTGRAITEMGLVWPGTEPDASNRLEKIGFKQICRQVGAPTPDFCVLCEEDATGNMSDPVQKERVVLDSIASLVAMNTSQPGLVKSIHGGGGKGTAHLHDPSDPEECRAAMEKVLSEMKRCDGIYFEQKVNTDGDGRFFQLELEVDGDTCAQGGRFVWFNSRLQKVVEIGLSDDLVEMFMPLDLYEKARVWSAEIARSAGNNTRATMEALVFTNKDGDAELQFIECNRRPQVENEALALLQVDSQGNRRYTFAELIMRAAGYPVPNFQPATDTKVVLHARWLHGNPDSDGNIAYQPGTVRGMSGPRLDWVASELMAPGEISFTADPQLGKAVIVAKSWDEMCSRAVEYFSLRRPDVQGPASTYAQTMQNLFGSPAFIKGDVASNETFKSIEIPAYPKRTLNAILTEQVAPILVNGYRPGEGIDPERFPTQNMIGKFVGISKALRDSLNPRATPFTRYTQGEITRDDYIESLRGQLSDQGGAWVTVAPRDTCQQGMDSESACVTLVSRRNAEMWAERAGCVGYEIGGAQFQAGLIRGFDPAEILQLGLPYNMPAHALQRSQYVNGLAELTSDVRKPLYAATADIVRERYGMEGNKDVPYFPYNFHAGNFFNYETGYCPQDDSTAEMLNAGILPMPNWVFSAKFTLEHLRAWTGRQINVFQQAGQSLNMLRIKNPGQGDDWTVDAIWEHVQVIRSVFSERNCLEPIIYIHNHDFNGLGGHVGRELFMRAQADGYNNLVIDCAYRKNGTHNDNTVLTSALNFDAEQLEALSEYNLLQMSIEQVLTRFDSRNSQMTPWNSDWAGGTEGSDLRIAKEYGLDPREINHAKEVASEVFPLERAVTPFSEYKLRLGIAIMINDDISPKTPDAVREFINKGGRLQVGAEVLVGLKRWETMVEKPPIVDKLLENMKTELVTAMKSNSSLIGPWDIGSGYSAKEKFTILGFQQKGLDFMRIKGEGPGDLTPLLSAPQVLHAAPCSLPMNSYIMLHTPEPVRVEFEGFGRAPNGDITVNFCHSGHHVIATVHDPKAATGGAAVVGLRKADKANPCHMGTVVPGEMLSYEVAVGDILVEGEPLCVLESMKMAVKIAVPSSLNGMRVKALPCKTRTAEAQGDVLTPGDLVVEGEASN